jgi:sulfur-carrier protein
VAHEQGVGHPGDATVLGYGTQPVDAQEGDVVTLRLFAAAREAAGTGRDEVPGRTVEEVIAAARQRYGSEFSGVLATSRVWRNGEPAAGPEPVDDHDEVAVLPPVSGG